MLTGMTTDERRKLTKAEIGPDGEYVGCECHRNTGQTTNTIIHRITQCPKFRRQREALFGSDNIIERDKNARKTNRIILGIDKDISVVEMLKGITRIAI